MNKKLFVGRLPFAFSDDQLRALFIKSGTVVNAVMVPDAKSGKTRGFGFVDMSTDVEAQAAIQAINGTSLEDKKIWVTLAREKGDAKPKEPPTNARRSFEDRPAPGRRPFGDRSAPGERRPFGDRPGPGNRRPFEDRSGAAPRRFEGKPGFGPKKYSPSGPTPSRRTPGNHFVDGARSAPSGDRKPPYRGSGDRKPFRSADARPNGPPRANGPASFPKKDFRPQEGFRGPPKRTGGRRPPPRGSF